MRQLILVDRLDKTSYYSREKALLPCLDIKNRIYIVSPNEIKKIFLKMRNKFNNLFSIQYLSSIKKTGKTEDISQLCNVNCVILRGPEFVPAGCEQIT